MNKQEQTPTVPRFNIPVREPVERYPDNEQCTLNSVDYSFQCSDEDYERIAAICSEPLVFDTLFKDNPRFKDGYTVESAKGFIDWARQG